MTTPTSSANAPVARSTRGAWRATRPHTISTEPIAIAPSTWFDGHRADCHTVATSTAISPTTTAAARGGLASDGASGRVASGGGRAGGGEGGVDADSGGSPGGAGGGPGGGGGG